MSRFLIGKVAITCIILLCILAGCKNTNSPEITAAKFITSVRQMDYETAKSLSTKSTWTLLQIMEANTKHLTEEEKEAFVKDFKVKILQREDENDSTVVLTYVTNPEFVIVPKLRLRSEEDQDGRIRWKVDISSLDDLGIGDDEIEERVSPIMEDDSISATTIQD
jgi:hypothetical protein